MPTAPVKVFYSYSHKDEDLRDKLEEHVAVLKRQGLISEWHDRRIEPGQEWNGEISTHLEDADLILLLVSAPFIKSRYCYEIEVKRAMERHEAREATVIPVLLKPCRWTGTPFEKLQALPAGARPVTKWGNREEAFTSITDGIAAAVASVQSGRRGATPPSAPTASRQRADLRDLPYAVSVAFSGREAELDAIRTALTTGGRAALTAVHGMGGVGKTQLALAYAERHAADYRTVGWLRAEDPSVLASDVAALAVRLHLVPDTADVQEAASALREWMEAHDDALVIFDNVPDPKSVRAYLPRWRGAHVLITSRYPRWDLARSVSIETWTPEAGADFLLLRLERPETERQAAERVAVELGGLPLALEQAAAYASRTGRSFESYLDLYRRQHGPLLAFRPTDADYPETVATTWLLSFEKLAEVSPVAVALLRVCAFLAPDDIPGDLLRTYPWPAPLDRVWDDEMAWDEAVIAASDYGLLKVDENRLSVHRLVQEVTRDQLRDERAMWAGQVFEAMVTLFPDDVLGDIAVWPTCSMLTPHALAAIDNIMQEGISVESSAELLNRLGLYADSRADYIGAEVFYRRALEGYEAVRGPDHPHTLGAINNLAYLLYMLGDINGAETLFRRALAGIESALGPDHPDTLSPVNNLASLLHTRGDLDGAEPLLRRALASRESVLGPDHPNTLLSLNNLATLLYTRGDLDGAEPLLRRALAGNESVLGPDHPDTLKAMNNLGLILYARGDLDGAEPLFRRALTGYVSVLGPDHPGTLLPMSNLGLLLYARGDLDGAEPLLRRALAGNESVLGPDHPDTLTPMSNLGLLLYRRGDFDEAEPLLHRVLASREAVQGLEHPDTLLSTHNIAYLIHAQGDLDKAEPLYRRALEGLEAKLGPEHPDTQSVRGNLNALLNDKRQRGSSA